MSGKQVLYIAIATFITAIIWIVVDIVHTQQQIQIPPEVNKLIEPINPNFDLEVLDEF